MNENSFRNHGSLKVNFSIANQQYLKILFAFICVAFLNDAE